MLKRTLYVLLILFIGIATSCSEDETEQGGNIYGIVTDTKTAEPMRAIGVELYSGGRLLLKTVTYDDGHYEFEDLDPGNYKLKVVAEGYSDVEYSVLVESGRTARTDMQISPLPTNMTVTTLAIGDPVDGVITLKGEFRNAYSSSYPNEVGFIYGQTQNINQNVGTIVKASLAKSFEAKLNITELSNGIWYVKAYAKNKIGYEFGEIRKFEFKSIPIVKTSAATNISETSATLNGLIVYEGNPKYSEKGFVYSSSYNMPTIDDPVNATSKVSVSGNSKEFSANVSDLTLNKTYHVRVYVKYGDEVIYGESISFVAEPYKPYVIIDKLAVQRTDLSTGTIWSVADELCKKSRVGGFTDWRLPTLVELTLMYENRNKIGGFSSGYYWSCDAGLNLSHISLSFTDGDTYNDPNNEKNSVRAVRTVK